MRMQDRQALEALYARVAALEAHIARQEESAALAGLKPKPKPGRPRRAANG